MPPAARSYTMAWRIGVALGLAGGIIQVAFALIRPSAAAADADGVVFDTC